MEPACALAGGCSGPVHGSESVLGSLFPYPGARSCFGVVLLTGSCEVGVACPATPRTRVGFVPGVSDQWVRARSSCPKALAWLWCEVLDLVVLDREGDDMSKSGPCEGFGGHRPTVTLSRGEEPAPGKARTHIDVNATDRAQGGRARRSGEVRCAFGRRRSEVVGAGAPPGVSGGGTGTPGPRVFILFRCGCGSDGPGRGRSRW